MAVLGSSGGNLRSHGGDDPVKLLGDIRKQLGAAGFELAEVQFVAADTSMDGASERSKAALWALADETGTGTITQIATGALAEINDIARERDAQLAARIAAGQVDALILVSADPSDTNNKAVLAAVEAGIPAAGTGGTSIATAQQLGLNLVSASGTTGTTSTTRAVAYVSGLARHWGVKYRPALGSAVSSSVDEPAWKRISIRGIMVGSIPAFITLALILAVSKIPVLSGLSEVFDLLIGALPIVVAAVAARRISGLDEVGLVAGAIAGILSQPGGILGGLVGGILAGLPASWLIKLFLGWRFPATTANIFTGAIAGALPGLLVFYLLAPFTNWLGESVQEVISWAVAFSPLLAGAIAGIVIWPAIIGGVYHAVILPLVLLEMSEKGHSFFGAIDMVSLVMVSFGITLANVLAPRTSGERALAGSGAAVNFFFGTFVEASYPFMFGDKRVFGVALGAAAVGGAVVGLVGAEATAYLPAVVAPFVATAPGGMVLAMLTGAGLAFVGTLLVNLAARKKARAAL
ncbi:PTS sugar transporter [Gulosibacter molinativorax]|uniref:PTS sugar transporter n=1 Tax=Gulosibacter molinativorax TaxID=256821 RepID=A0ABT7C428_9MICO|nr:PTS sugar transporter [Gulosibacter molinativorax]